MRRTRERLEQDRADLVAALQDASERPVSVPALVASAYGYTLDTIPDRVLDVAMRRASPDLRYLHRHGQIVMSYPFVATYVKVDLPGSDLANRAAETQDRREDEDDLRRAMAGWEEAEA